MERIYSTLLIAVCGLAIITFGLAAIAANTNPNTDYEGQIWGTVLLLTGLTIFVCSGIFDKPKTKKSCSKQAKK